MTVVSFFFKDRRSPSDWSNQELAEFYRVEAALVRAGLPVDVDRGLSDEGDPWFVFCNSESGEVIIHFARISGSYLIASRALGQTLRGANFRALIELLLGAFPVLMPGAEPEKRAASKVIIHPAALLVALVMTCFLKSSIAEASEAESPPGAEGAPAPAIAQSAVKGSGEVGLVLADQRQATLFIAAIAFAVALGHPTGTEGGLSSDGALSEFAPLSLGKGFIAREPTSAAEDGLRQDAAWLHQETPKFEFPESLVTFWPVAPTPALVEAPMPASPEVETLVDERIISELSGDAVDLAVTLANLGGGEAFEPQAGSLDVTATSVAMEAIQYLETTLGATLFQSALTSDLDIAYVEYLYGLAANLGETGSGPSSPKEGVEGPLPASLGDLATEIEAKVAAFIAQNPDFKLLRFDQGFIMFDADVGTGEEIAIQGLEFADGSMIVLVGLATDPFFDSFV